MTVPLITVYTGDSPNRNTQNATTFTLNAIDWLDYQLVQIPDTNLAITEINNTSTTINNDALAAANSAAESATSAVEAEASSLVAQSLASFKGRWSDATGAATVPSSYSNNGKTWQLLQDIPDITLDEPVSGAANWQVVNEINMSNVNVSELENPLLHAFAKNTLLRVINNATVLTSERSTTATSVDINNIVIESEIDDPREELNGWLFEGEKTNEAIHRRDFTNAAWVKTNITALKDATGHDGVANASSTLTATAANGTAYQTVTKASAENTYSIDVRRKTGTGVIQITDNDGATFTDITSSINSSTYTRFQITTTQTNPVFGVRIVTSTDEVEVDYAQLEVAKFASSRIDIPSLPAVASTRGAGSISLPSQGNFRESEGCIFLKADVIGDREASQQIILIDDTTTNNIISLFVNNSELWLLIVTDGANQVNGMITAFPSETQAYIAVNYSDNDVEIFVNGVSVKVDTSVLMPSGLTDVYIGKRPSPAVDRELFGHIQDLRFYQKQRTVDEIKYLGGI